MKKELRITHLENCVDHLLSLINMLEERICALEHAEPICVPFSQVQPTQSMPGATITWATTHPSPERFTREVHRQPDFGDE